MEKTDNNPTYVDQWNEFLKENEAFCQANPDDISLPYITPKNPNQENANANQMLRAIIKNEVDKWNKENEGANFPDWKNEYQWKYSPWADMDPSSGSGFAYAYYDGWSTIAVCGSRLCTPSREICKRLFEKYILIYEVWFCK